MFLSYHLLYVTYVYNVGLISDKFSIFHYSANCSIPVKFCSFSIITALLYVVTKHKPSNYSFHIVNILLEMEVPHSIAVLEVN